MGRLLWLGLGLPLIGLLGVVVGLTFYCHRLLEAAAEGRIATIGEVPLFLVASGFLFASIVIVGIHSLRVAGRISGPEYRLRKALQRITAGDVAFRVDLRRGDLLTGLARDCNELLDWLNQNPPSGMRTGTDVHELAHAPEPETAAEPAEEREP